MNENRNTGANISAKESTNESTKENTNEKPNENKRETTVPHALSLLFPSGSVVELRALGDAGVKNGYFTDFELLADRARTLDAFSDVRGVYVTLNTVDPALLSRRANRVKHRLSRTDATTATTADADIIHRRWLPIDLVFHRSGAQSCDHSNACPYVKFIYISRGG